MPFQIFSLQPEPRQATQDGVDSYLSFEAREGRAHAIVQTVSEGQVSVWLASDIKLSRQCKLLRVAIGRTKAEADELALLDLLSGNVNIFQCNSPHLLDRTIVAK